MTTPEEGWEAIREIIRTRLKAKILGPPVWADFGSTSDNLWNAGDAIPFELPSGIRMYAIQDPARPSMICGVRMASQVTRTRRL